MSFATVDKEQETQKKANKVRELIPEFIAENRATLLGLMQKDIGFGGEVGGSLCFSKDRKKLEFTEETNELFGVLSQYMPAIRNVANATCSREDIGKAVRGLELFTMMLGGIERLDADEQKAVRTATELIENRRIFLDPLGKPNKELVSKNKELIRQTGNDIIKIVETLFDSRFVGFENPLAVAHLHLHEERLPPSPADVQGTVGTGRVEIVITYDILSITPYLVYDGKVEKLDELDMVPARKK